MFIIDFMTFLNKYLYSIYSKAIDEDAKMKMDSGNFEIVLLKPVIESQKCGFVIPIIRKCNLSISNLKLNMLEWKAELDLWKNNNFLILKMPILVLNQSIRFMKLQIKHIKGN